MPQYNVKFKEILCGQSSLESCGASLKKGVADYSKMVCVWLSQRSFIFLALDDSEERILNAGALNVMIKSAIYTLFESVNPG